MIVSMTGNYVRGRRWLLVILLAICASGFVLPTASKADTVVQLRVMTDFGEGLLSSDSLRIGGNWADISGENVAPEWDWWREKIFTASYPAFGGSSAIFEDSCTVKSFP